MRQTPKQKLTLALLPQVATASLRPTLRHASCRARLSSRSLLTQTILPRTESIAFTSRRLISTTIPNSAVAEPSQRSEISFADILTDATSKTPQTLTEKIVQEHAVGLPEGKVLRSGDYVQIVPHRIMSHDNTAAILNKYQQLGAKSVKDPKQLMFAIDHDVQNKSPANLAKYERIRAFAEEQGVENYPAGYGIGHQVMVSVSCAANYSWRCIVTA